MLARQLRAPRPTSFWVGAGLFVLLGCSSSGTTSTAVTHPTMIEVTPESFLGGVPCSPDGPGLKRYVATLFDANRVGLVGTGGTASIGPDDNAGGSDDQPHFQLPSSTPTQCRASVGFGNVVSGRYYDVEIDGYDTNDVQPRALGSRYMVARDGRAPVTPRWRAKCKSTLAVDLTIVGAYDCETFEVDPSAAGSVTIPLGALLGALRCGQEPGEVDHFEVSLSVPDGDEPEARTVPCTADARAVYEGLAPNQSLSAQVTAFSADGTSPLAGAGCSVGTRADANVAATCGALNQTGTLRVDLAMALAELDLSCSSPELNRLEIRIPGVEQPQTITPAGCIQPFDRGFAAGSAALTVSVLGGTSGMLEELGSLTCHGEVTPGQLSSAECEANLAN